MMFRIRTLLAVTLSMAVAFPLAAQAQSTEERILFDGARDKHYFSFRIPALLAYKSKQTGKNVIMAFAEGRKRCGRDTGNIDTVMRISKDGGKTWTKRRNLAGRRMLNNKDKKDNGTWGNPTAAYDAVTGTVWLMLNNNAVDRAKYPCKKMCDAKRQQRCIAKQKEKKLRPGDRKVYVMSSRNDGKTWSKPRNITSTVQLENTVWDAVGPGNGIQLQGECSAGALVFPAIGRNIYTTDHGKTWNTTQRIPRGTSEATLVELSDGSLLRNDRPVSRTLVGSQRRPVSRSRDCGATWEEWYPHPDLPTTRVHASQIRLKSVEGDVLVFANPSSTESRKGMMLRLSGDGGETWPASRVVHPSVSAYPSLAELPGQKIALLYEKGGNAYNRQGKIAFFKGPLKWLAEGREATTPPARTTLQPATRSNSNSNWSNPDSNNQGGSGWSNPDASSNDGKPFDPNNIEGLPWLKSN